MDIIDIILVVSLIFILLYVYLDGKYSYWAKKGVPHLPATSLIFGNVKELVTGNEVSATHFSKIYRQFPDEPYCGEYEFQNPVLVLRDPQIIQTVLVEKFHAFQDNKFQMSEKNDVIMGQNPFVIKGSGWKSARAVLAATMTSNKIKVLEEIVKVVYSDMTKFIDDNNKNGIEAFDLASRFASETVANFGWGIRSNGFSSQSVIKEGFDLIKFVAGRLSMALLLVNPFLAYWLKIRLFPKQLEDFLFNITEQVVTNLKTNSSHQFCLVQHFLSAKEKLKNNGKDPTLKEVTGLVGVLYLDGYETTARAFSYILYTLMQHPQVQQRLRDEINDVVENDFTIENVNKMVYLDMVISEILRLYSPVQHLGRICTEKCTLGAVQVDVGTAVIIPVFALHYDPKYFPDPDIFNPENFSEENKSKRHKFVHLPFGQGPRICLGVKLAMAEIKLILCKIVKDYELIKPTNHQVKPIEPHPGSPFVLIPDHPLYMQFKKIC